jgi:flavorubredoxin
MSEITEVAADVYRISMFVPEINMQFNQFLLRDDEPLLVHTGLKAHFASTLQAVSKVIRPQDLRWIGFSHFEADECGALADWQRVAPRSDAVCSIVAKAVSIDDSAALRPALGLTDGQVLRTGKYTVRLLQTPHVPHCWEAAMLFEETQRTLFCSDLFHHNGDVPAHTERDLIEPFRAKLLADEGGPFAFYMPWTSRTGPTLERLAALRPRTLAIMHGSTFIGDGGTMLTDATAMMKDVLVSSK